MNRAYAVMMSIICRLAAPLAGLVGVSVAASAAWADQPHAWQLDLQAPATEIMHQIRWFEHYTLWFIVPVTLFVLALLIVVAVKFRAARNPNPSRVSHNAIIEVVWTLAPVLILFLLAIPSFNLLNAQLEIPKTDMTVKATATQWQWNYEYEGSGKGDNAQPVAFDSYLLKDQDRAAAGKEDRAVYPRLLAVDNEMVIPVGKTVRLLVTSAPTDVIHAFAMPAFGVKIDAVPGRLNETWFRAEREGLYYGQCSELCGKDHAFMPIAIRVVPQEKYDAWLTAAANDLPGAYKALLASTDSNIADDLRVAANDVK
ncbi:cytochrome c oxidase subunit II [Neorhizobium sp. NCHU2750]|uniref:cytochrome c oxidase subunit II n=1 Tax=Neorhizobium sp. NCHU2750 TaxID=1825976 RepID=UPI000E763518|nr:cytochrome c oxidase subunit II [Neorhizobium sp. NCHU2750]